MKKHIPWIAFIIVGIILFAFSMESRGRNAANEIAYTDFMTQVNRNNVHDITINSNEVKSNA
jgi:hypothetical protein